MAEGWMDDQRHRLPPPIRRSERLRTDPRLSAGPGEVVLLAAVAPSPAPRSGGLRPPPRDSGQETLRCLCPF